MRSCSMWALFRRVHQRTFNMPIKTLGDRIAVLPVPGAGKIGLLFIPDATKSTRNQTFCRAKVKSAGKKVIVATEGRIIVVSEYFGDEVEVDGKKLRIGRERDIVGVMVNGNVDPQSVGDRVLVERIEPPEKVGRILLPEDIREPQFRATVLASGPKCVVKRDDVVLIPKSVSVVVRLEGKEYYLVDELAILAVL
jgi:co-chaperonin GroES (HSP10)